MVIDTGYVCKKCGKVYHKSKQNLPNYCKKCGCDLVHERYLYNITRDGRETRDTNMFGGYDYVKTILTQNAVPVKLVRKWMRWEVFEEKEVE